MSKNLDKMEASKPFIETKSTNEIHKETTHILGFCFDGTASFRPGARFGADAIREASFGIETYSPYLDRDLKNYSIVDLGNLPIFPSDWRKTNDYFHKITKDLSLKDSKIKILTLGGEHSISLGPIRLYLDQYKDLVLIHLDAHADFRDGYLGEKYSHASIMKRVWDHMSETNELIQYGVRSGLKGEFDFMQKHNTLAHSLTKCLERIGQIDESRPIYLTLDLDFFDPAFVPGTGTPEAGGEDFHGFIKIIKCLKEKNFIGADIVELAPMLDSSGASSAFASKVTREILLALQD